MLMIEQIEQFYCRRQQPHFRPILTTHFKLKLVSLPGWKSYPSHQDVPSREQYVQSPCPTVRDSRRTWRRCGQGTGTARGCRKPHRWPWRMVKRLPSEEVLPAWEPRSTPSPRRQSWPCPTRGRRCSQPWLKKVNEVKTWLINWFLMKTVIEIQTWLIEKKWSFVFWGWFLVENENPMEKKTFLNFYHATKFNFSKHSEAYCPCWKIFWKRLSKDMVCTERKDFNLPSWLSLHPHWVRQ